MSRFLLQVISSSAFLISIELAGIFSWIRSFQHSNSPSLRYFNKSGASASALTGNSRFHEPRLFVDHAPGNVDDTFVPGPDIACTTTTRCGLTLAIAICSLFIHSPRANRSDQSLNPMMSMQQGSWKVKKLTMKLNLPSPPVANQRTKIFNGSACARKSLLKHLLHR